MNLSITITKEWLSGIRRWFSHLDLIQVIIFLSIILAIVSTEWSFLHGYIIAYGDAESHLNIAKRVIDSLTPGFAQLGGIWLPLPHLLMVPFVYFNILWRTGLAGSIVSGASYMVSAVYTYKLVLLITKNKSAAFFGALVFMTNPNILYMQSTPMTELTLIVFFILSSYYFILFLQNDQIISNLLAAALFGFCASLSRYDGWALVLMEAFVLFLYYFPYWGQILSWSKTWRRKLIVRKAINHLDEKRVTWHTLEGNTIIFSTLAFFGILLWLGWGWLILGDPLYFSHSQFSAASQQQNWLGHGELPGYHNLWMSFIYYFVTSMSNIGVIAFILALTGFIYYLCNPREWNRVYILLVLLVPFFFNVVTLFLGQSVIFIPSLTPTTFDWTLFNVRYGIMMVPFAGFAIGYLFAKVKLPGKILLSVLFICQFGLYFIGYSPVITLADGVTGLSSEIAKIPDAQQFIDKNYDGGLVLEDDFSRTISVVKSPIPMKDVIYVGNKPYWEESLNHPEAYAKWIIMQQNDTVWNALWENPTKQAELYTYFNKVYTSDNILIFKRIPGK